MVAAGSQVCFVSISRVAMASFFAIDVIFTILASVTATVRVGFKRVPGVVRVGAKMITDTAKSLGRGILLSAGHPVLRQGQVLIEKGACIPEGLVVDVYVKE
jgi:hypothetical protein